TYNTYTSLTEAEQIAGIFNKNGIKTEIIKRVPQMDALILGNSYNNDYELKISQADFQKANDLLFMQPIDISSVDRDHPLFLLSDEELKDVIQKPEEWGGENYQLATAILKSRNIDIPADHFEHVTQERHTKLNTEQKSVSSVITFLGYLVPLGACVSYLIAYMNDGYFYNVRWGILSFFGV